VKKESREDVLLEKRCVFVFLHEVYVMVWCIFIFVSFVSLNRIEWNIIIKRLVNTI